MSKAIIGYKLGMSQVFTTEGLVIPVTVIQAGPCTVVQTKTIENDGYEALKIAFGDVKERNINSPDKGQFKKVGVGAKRFLREIKVSNVADYAIGSEIRCDIFEAGEKIDVVGITKGHGFSGTVKRWNTHIGPKAHGSGYHRGPGSMGATTDPSRVFKNKKMPGQYGNERVTIQNLLVVKVDVERNLLLVKGAVPGCRGSLVTIKDSVKNKK